MVTVKGSEKNYPNLRKVNLSNSVTLFLLNLLQLYFKVEKHAMRSSLFPQNTIKTF
jgi:hypothetical protein